MKKKFLVIWALMLISLAFTGCEAEGESTTEEDHATETVEINIGILMGPSAMGMVGLMDEVDNDNIDNAIYNFTLAGSADELVPEIVQGNLDIAALPSNLAPVLYNNTEGDVQVIAINTLGILHIVEVGEAITSMEDLYGRTIYASGAGATPEFVLNYLLEGNGIDPQNDVNIEWLAEHTEVASRMAISEDGVAMLPQPFATVAQNENDNLRLALDLTEEWDLVQASSDESSSALIMGVLVARRELIDQNPEAINEFLNRFDKSVQFVNGNVDEAAELIEYYDLFPAPIATRALPHSNITFIAGEEMKELFSGYLQVLFEQNPESIGGEMPSDEFYYIN